MPLTYAIDPEQNFAKVVATGVITLDDCLRMIRTVAADLSQHQCGSLVDVRDLDYYPSVSDLKEIAFEYIRLRTAFRCGIAFIVSNDKHFSLGRLLAALVDSAGLRIGVFRDPSEAESWLKGLIDVHLTGDA